MFALGLKKLLSWLTESILKEKKGLNPEVFLLSNSVKAL